jgi:peptidyl-dipeptidase A
MNARAMTATALALLAGCATPQGPGPAAGGHAPSASEEAATLLPVLDELYRALFKVAYDGDWSASTDVTPEHTAGRVVADGAFAAFVGNPKLIATERRLLSHRAELPPLVVQELEHLLLDAAETPETQPELVKQRIDAEAKAREIQDGFQFCLQRRAGRCEKPVSANDLDRLLRESRDPKERLAVWTASKEIGPPLRDHLAELRDLRNRSAREMGYSSYFALGSAEYHMPPAEFLAMLDRFTDEIRPLSDALACYARRTLSERYHAVDRDGPIPAQWLGNRWAQAWPGLAPSVDTDAPFRGRTKEWIAETAERFWESIGLQPVPKTFWERSDLWALPATAARKKNAHASAWHMDLDQDVRSLQNIEPSWQWFETAHHELGHVHYFLAYSRPGVPYVLRRGATGGIQEGVGELGSLASAQEPYLRKVGALGPGDRIDADAWMLERAFDDAIPFIGWAAGTVSHFEYDLYEKELPVSEFDARWWHYAAKYQRVAPPTPRSGGCDACTKTHIIDTPAYYFHYVIARAFRYQLHRHICTKILHQDPHACDYSGHKEVGAFLTTILDKGATEDWRKLLRDATGEELSLQAMVEYYAPLLQKLGPARCKLE